MELTLFVSKVTGDEKNCSYPYKVVVNNPDELKDAVRFDHVCAEYRNGYRRNSNFVVSDCAVMDCDNDASDDSEDWITPEALIEELDDVPFAVTLSRHHMKSKNGKPPRPKFHVYFKISEIRDPDAYKALKERIQQEYPFFLMTMRLMQAASFMAPSLMMRSGMKEIPRSMFSESGNILAFKD